MEPLFFQSGESYIKVTSDTEWVDVRYNRFQKSIVVIEDGHHAIEFWNKEGTTVGELKYREKCARALEYIKTKC